MAEFVNQSVEEMLPELEQMERVRLFSKEETRQILKKRQRLEYRLRKKTKVEEDYIRYIEYERNLLALIKKRRQSTGYTFKKLEIDIPIVQRIHRLYQLCQVRFPHSEDAWLQHIEFCKKRKEFTRVSRLFTAMLRTMNKKPELWLAAARWEVNQSNLDTGRSLMTRGISFNSSSIFLWVEYYRLELETTEMLRKGREIIEADLSKEDDPTLTGAIADIVHRQALEQFPDNIDVLVSLIEVCQKFSFARPQLELMVTMLREKFSHVPRTWDLLARRLLPRKEGKVVASVKEEEEEHCFTIFQQGVKEAPVAETWTLYLKTCLELIPLFPVSKARGEKRVRRALDVFKAASDESYLTADMFLEWVQLLTIILQVEEAERVGKLGVNRYPKSLDLWRALLFLKFQSLSPAAEVLALLNKGLSKVSEKKAWALWEPTLEYLAACKYDDLMRLMEKATVSMVREVCMPAKLMCLRGTFLNQGVKATRAIYKQLSVVKPLPLEFYFEYADMELSQSKLKMKKVRRAYEDAVTDYGNCEEDVWLRYIQMESECPEGEALRVGQIYTRATQSLQGSTLAHFIHQYNLTVSLASQEERATP